MLTKVAVITLVGRHNYGNRLQNYAVEQIYRSFNLEPETLVLSERFRLARAFKVRIKALLGYDVGSPESRMSCWRLAAFDRFNELINLHHIDSPHAVDWRAYGLVSVGSDQVWSPGEVRNNGKWYFLHYAQPMQRIALAPSIGVSDLTSKQARALAKGIAGFPRLSIREQQGSKLISDVAAREAHVLCDPTLLLGPSEWRRVADSRLTPTEPYVLAYILGNRSSDVETALRIASCGGETRVISLSDREKPGEPPAGPAEFLSLVDNAMCVVTDSYHAAIFSSIFQTPLTIVRRAGGCEMFSRLETLSQMLGLDEKVFGGAAYDPSRAGDYDGVPMAIAEKREEFLRYLAQCIGTQLSACRCDGAV